MSKEIEEIIARHAVYPPRPGAPLGFFIAHQDIATLLAEDARHRAEIERLRTEAMELARGLGKADAKVALLSRDYDDARAEVERLSLALRTIRDQGGDVVERWSSEVAYRALEDRR